MSLDQPISIHGYKGVIEALATLPGKGFFSSAFSGLVSPDGPELSALDPDRRSGTFVLALMMIEPRHSSVASLSTTPAGGTAHTKGIERDHRHESRSRR